MATKELLIEYRIALPEDMFDSAVLLAKLRDARDGFVTELTGLIGEDGFTTRTETVTKRKPRAPGAAKPGRKPRNTTNGAGDVADHAGV